MTNADITEPQGLELERPSPLPDEAYLLATFWYPHAKAQPAPWEWVRDEVLTEDEFVLWQEWGEIDPDWNPTRGKWNPDCNELLEILAEAAYILQQRKHTNGTPEETT